MMNFIDPSINRLQASVTIALKQMCNALKAQGKKIHDLTIGENPMPIPDILVKELQKHAYRREYATKGVSGLLEAIAAFHERDGVRLHPDNILVGPGLKQMIAMLKNVLVCHVICVAPCWVSYIPQAQLYGRSISIIETKFEDNWKLTPQMLRACLQGIPMEHNIKPKLIILNYPTNPTGMTYSNQELKIFADIARSYNAIILSDEIYSELHYNGEHRSIAHDYPEGTIIASGVSKWPSAAGWRLGYLAFPQELVWLKKEIAKLASVQYTSVHTPTQMAVIPAFTRHPEVQEYLLHVRRIFKALSQRTCKILNDADIRISQPDGGIYVLPDFNGTVAHTLYSRNIFTSDQLCTRLLEEQGVALISGSACGLSEKSLTARISIVDVDGEALLKHSYELGLENEFDLEDNDPRWESTLTACRKIGDWL